MAKLKGLEKVELLIQENKLGRARDSLHGLVIAFPCDVSLRSRLGDVYFMLGYPIEAGRFWYLDTDLTEQKQEAIVQFEASCNGEVVEILQKLKVRCDPIDLTTMGARQRLDKLLSQDVGLKPFVADYVGPKAGHVPSKLDKTCGPLTAFGCLVIVGLAAVGIVTVVNWFTR